jgi:polysaccharide biosynthesis transport protein
MSEQEIQSVFSLVWERRQLAFCVAVLTVAGGITYTLLAPPIWEAKATLVFPVKTPSILGAGNFEQSGLAGALGGGPTPLKVYGGMIESERALDMVAKGVGVDRRDVRDMRDLQDQATQSSLTITARHTNAELAKKVVALHIDALTEINKSISDPLTSDDAEVLKVRVSKQQKLVNESEMKLLAFQKGAITAPGVVAVGSGKDSSVVPTSGRWSDMLRQFEIEYARVDSAVRDAEARTARIARDGKNLPSALPPVKRWRDRLTELQYDLKMKELTLTAEAPEVVKAKKAIDITQQQLESELKKYATATSAGMVDPITDNDEVKLPSLLTQRVSLEAQIRAVRKLANVAPNEAIELSRLTRELTTRGAILQQLQGQYELAALQAGRDPNRWEVLDEPRVDEKPVNKSLSKTGILSLLAGCALGCLVALLAPRRRPKLAALPAEEETRKAA